MGVFSLTAQHRGLKAFQEAADLGVVGIFIRIAAKLIDLAVLFGLTMGMSIVVGRILALSGCKINSQGHRIPVVAAIGINLLLLIALLSPSETIAGCTLGKLVFRLRVVKDDGSPCTLLASVLRNFLFYFDTLFSLVICVMDSPMQQRLGDMVAQTVVISTKKTKLERTWPIKKSVLGLLASYAAVIIFVSGFYVWQLIG